MSRFAGIITELRKAHLSMRLQANIQGCLQPHIEAFGKDLAHVWCQMKGPRRNSCKTRMYGYGLRKVEALRADWSSRHSYNPSETAPDDVCLGKETGQEDSGSRVPQCPDILGLQAISIGAKERIEARATEAKQTLRSDPLLPRPVKKLRNHS